MFAGNTASADEPGSTERVKRTFKQRCAEPAVAILHQDRRARREMISRFGVEGENGSTDDSLPVTHNETHGQVSPNRVIEPGVHNLHDGANSRIPDRIEHE